ncbi:MAG TPA: hypothetical protein VMY77_00360, partial [Chitinophagaceae bacterium]|nr:hypothetical protein [Chitinophagaceae bacterium]
MALNVNGNSALEWNAAINLDDFDAGIVHIDAKLKQTFDESVKLSKDTNANLAKGIFGDSDKILNGFQTNIRKGVEEISVLRSSLPGLKQSVQDGTAALSEIASTAAESSFSIMDLAGGWGLLAGAVVAGAIKLYDWINAESEAEKTQRLLNTAINEAVASLTSEIIELTTLVKVARDATESTKTRQQAIDNINKSYPELHNNLNLENINTRAVTVALVEQIEALKEVAKQKSISRLVDKTSEELEAAKQKFQEDKNNLGLFSSPTALAKDAANIKILTDRLNDFSSALVENTKKKNESEAATDKGGRLKQIDDQLKKLKADKDFHASTIAETKDFNDKIKKLQAERDAIDPPEVKAAKVGRVITPKAHAEQSSNHILEERKRLLRELIKLERDSSQSGLVREQSEIDKIKQKYSEAIQKVVDYNDKVNNFNVKNPKANIPRINLEEATTKIIMARNIELANTESKQKAAIFIQSLDRQKEIFSQYEDAKNEI